MRSTRSRTSGRLALLALVSLAVLALPQQRLLAAEVDEVVWALPGLPDTLLVAHAWSVNTGGVMSLVQEGLMAFDDELAVTNGVADEFEQTDPLTYVYRIGEGVVFHDGSPVKAEDVAYSMNWHLDPANGSQMAPFYASVDAIEATGEREVTVHLKRPDAQFQYTPAHMGGFIMQKAQMEAHPDDYGTPSVLPIGTGPYRLTEFVPGERIVVEASGNYRGDAPAVGRITFLAIADQQTRLLAMRKGDIDGTFGVPISEIDQWEALDDVDVVTKPSLGIYMLTLDLDTPPLDNLDVRRAIAQSVDREGLVAALLKGKGASAVSVNPPEMWAGVLDADEVREFYATLDPHTFDLAAAKAAWEASGAEGFSMSVPVSSSDPYMASIVLTLAQNVAPLGIDISVRELDHTQWLDGINSHVDLGLQMRRYFPDYADPANYPYLFYAGANATVNGTNTSNYRNAEVDALLDEALQQSEPAQRADALEAVTRKVNDDLAIVPIFWPDTAMAIRSDLRLDGFSAFWYNTPWAVRGFGPK